MKSQSELWAILGKSLDKGKTYIDSPADAPKGAKVQQGPKGGYYYDSSGMVEEKPDRKPSLKPTKHSRAEIITDPKEITTLVERDVRSGDFEGDVEIYKIVADSSGFGSGIGHTVKARSPKEAIEKVKKQSITFNNPEDVKSIKTMTSFELESQQNEIMRLLREGMKRTG